MLSYKNPHSLFLTQNHKQGCALKDQDAQILEQALLPRQRPRANLVSSQILLVLMISSRDFSLPEDQVALFAIQLPPYPKNNSNNFSDFLKLIGLYPQRLNKFNRTPAANLESQSSADTFPHKLYSTVKVDPKIPIPMKFIRK